MNLKSSKNDPQVVRATASNNSPMNSSMLSSVTISAPMMVATSTSSTCSMSRCLRIARLTPCSTRPHRRVIFRDEHAHVVEVISHPREFAPPVEDRLSDYVGLPAVEVLDESRELIS